MKYIFMLLLLASCGGESARTLHAVAKSNPEKRFCYNVKTPNEIVGRYCLEYVGEMK
jgi:hypothetical protein